MKVKVGGPGKVSVTGTVPARRLGARQGGRRGPPGSAAAAGTVTIRLRLTTAGRKRKGRLKGTKLTLRILQGSRSATKVVRLR